MTKPLVSDELLKYLREHFPEKAPEASETDRQLMFRGGQVDVVRHLAFLKAQQDKNIMKA